MANLDDIMKEVNNVLKAYNYLDSEDSDMGVDELPSLVSHLLLLRVFTQECVRFAIPYNEVEDFCEYAIDYIYKKENEGSDVSRIDIEEIVDSYNSNKGPKH